MALLENKNLYRRILNVAVLFILTMGVATQKVIQRSFEVKNPVMVTSNFSKSSFVIIEFTRFKSAAKIIFEKLLNGAS